MSFIQKTLNQKNQFFIKYRPELKQFFGSQASVLIFEKIEYWNKRSDPQKGFWKFFEPCEKHPLYKKDDSWAEELQMSRRVFLRAFAIIGTHYKSKSEYIARSDPFQGKMYASYYDRKTNRTHFLRNHSVVEKFLNSLWEGTKKLSKLVKEKVENGRSCNDTNGRSFAHALDISLQISTSSQKLSELKSLSSIAKAEIEKEKDKNIEISENMLKIWNKITLNQQSLRSDLKIKLPQALKESFQESLELWTNFCKKIASSKFLMGEAPNSKFKAYFSWLIKPETIEAIQDGHYSLGDRQVNYCPTSDQKPETFNRNEVQGTESWKDVCEQLSNKLGYNTFKSWFKELNLLNEETTQPTLHCPTRFMRDWISTHYQSDLECIMKQVLPHITHLEFEGGIS